MSITFLGGLLLALGGIVLSTFMEGNAFGVLIGPGAAVLVMSGAIGATSVGYSARELRNIPRAVRAAMRGREPDVDTTIDRMIRFAGVARRDGVLALERRLDEVDDRFQRAGFQMIVDGMDPDQVRQFLEIEIAAVDERHRSAISYFKTMAGYGPTMGLVGTIIGLVNMLSNLSDPSQLGHGMSLALLATLYGVLAANMLFMPVAEKLERANSAELSALDMAMDGILAIQAGASPRILTERLESYLSHDRRIGYERRMSGSDDRDSENTRAGAAA